MALNIKNRATEQLVAEVAAMTGETKTRAVQVALEERKARLSARTRRKSLHQFLEEEIWPLVPETERGQPSLTKAEREEILGIGPDGV